MKCFTANIGKLLLLTIVSLGMAIGCEEKSDDSSTTPPGGGSNNKATLSSWATANAAWAIRLDLSGANLTGTPFSLTVKFSDSSEVHCTATISGTDASGSYNISSCASTMPGSNNMSDSVGGTAFETGGAGTYVSNGATFYWCRANNACFTYY